MMLLSENIEINGNQYIRTWSDADVMIERDGGLYESAVDPAELGRTYRETDKPILQDELLLATDGDYIKALESFGVVVNDEI